MCLLPLPRLPLLQGVRIPVFISGTIVDNSGRTLSGQTNEAFWNSVSHAKPMAIGLNCALGATDMHKYIANLSACADCYVFCYPNAGLPNAMGGYDQKGPEMAEDIRPFCECFFGCLCPPARSSACLAACLPVWLPACLLCVSFKPSAARGADCAACLRCVRCCLCVWLSRFVCKADRHSIVSGNSFD